MLAFGSVAIATAARGQDAVWHPCREAQTPIEKVDKCSQAIPVLRSRVLLERAYNRRGLANQALGRYEAAVKDFTALLSINPNVAGYWDNRQNVFRQMGDARRALADANEAIRLAPGYSFVHRSRGLLFADIGRFDLALGDLNTAIGIDGRDAGLRVERGRILNGLGRVRDAIEDFSTALAIDPKTSTALLERAKAHLGQGLVQAAFEDISLFVLLEPNNAEGAQVQAQINVALGRMAPPSSYVPTNPEPSRKIPESAGSGFFIANNGYIVTNFHVVEKCSFISIREDSGKIPDRGAAEKGCRQ